MRTCAARACGRRGPGHLLAPWTEAKQTWPRGGGSLHAPRCGRKPPPPSPQGREGRPPPEAVTLTAPGCCSRGRGRQPSWGCLESGLLGRTSHGPGQGGLRVRNLTAQGARAACRSQPAWAGVGRVHADGGPQAPGDEASVEKGLQRRALRGGHRAYSLQWGPRCGRLPSLMPNTRLRRDEEAASPSPGLVTPGLL